MLHKFVRARGHKKHIALSRRVNSDPVFADKNRAQGFVQRSGKELALIRRFAKAVDHQHARGRKMLANGGEGFLRH